MRNVILSASLLIIISLGAIGGCNDDGGGGSGEDGLGDVPGPGDGGPSITISPNVPADISGGAPNADFHGLGPRHAVGGSPAGDSVA